MSIVPIQLKKPFFWGNNKLTGLNVGDIVSVEVEMKKTMFFNNYKLKSQKITKISRTTNTGTVDTITPDFSDRNILSYFRGGGEQEFQYEDEWDENKISDEDSSDMNTDSVSNENTIIPLQDATDTLQNPAFPNSHIPIARGGSVYTLPKTSNHKIRKIYNKTLYSKKRFFE